jgi:hypothetical protein
MSSKADPAVSSADPRNDLLHHFPVRRLEAEAIRDSILAISGRLNPTMYGPESSRTSALTRTAEANRIGTARWRWSPEYLH